MLVRLHETVLSGLFGILGIAEHTVARGIDHVLVLAHELAIGSAVAIQYARDEGCVVHLRRCDEPGVRLGYKCSK